MSVPSKIVVSAILLNEEDKVLLIRRSETDTSRSGQWDIPGGTQKVDESIESTLIREVREETGITADNPKLVYTSSFIAHSSSRDTTFNYIYLVFRATCSSYKVTLSFEHSEFQWLPIKEAMDIVGLQQHSEALERLIDIS